MEPLKNLLPSNGDSFRKLLLRRPPVVTQNLQFLLIHDEHNAILGGTNMSDLSWTGTLWHFNDLTDLDKRHAAITQEMECGVCDAAYLDQSKFVVVDDSGGVKILKITTEQKPRLKSVAYACQHDSSTLAVSVFPNKRNIVTAGMDYCMKVWDVEDLVATHSYNFAHSDIITGVDVKPMCNHTIASASLDGESLLWDIRCGKAVRVLHKSNGYQLTAVTWNTNVDHLVVVGAEDGTVVLVDIRQTDVNSTYDSIKCSRAVHKLLFNPNPEKKEQLAGCFDDTTVHVFDSSRQLLEIFKANSHSDFVQGLAWYKDDLFSCAWDGTVNKHTVLSDFDSKTK